MIIETTHRPSLFPYTTLFRSKTHLQGTPCITMKKAIFTFARWDNAWKRVVREKLKQSQDINKPTVAIQQIIARVVHLEAYVLKEKIKELSKEITDWNTTYKKHKNFSNMKSEK